jgi:hypothetical protein
VAVARAYADCMIALYPLGRSQLGTTGSTGEVHPVVPNWMQRTTRSLRGQSRIPKEARNPNSQAFSEKVIHFGLYFPDICPYMGIIQGCKGVVMHSANVVVRGRH